MIFAFAGCATAPTEYVEPAPLAMNKRTALNSRVFAAAWELVNEKYFDPKFKGVDWPAMRTKYAPAATAAADDDALYRVLDEMVGELRDKHVFVISPRRVHEGRARHRPETGLRQRRMGDDWIVTDLVPGSPAEVAGVRRGWRIVLRNDRPLPDEEKLDDFLPRVGEVIRYMFSDEHEQPREVEIAPQLTSFDSTRFVSRELPGGIRYLRFDYFDFGATRWFVGEIKSHRDAPGVIIDLRNNPGGRMQSLRRAVGQFFSYRRELGQTVTRTGKTREPETYFLFSAQYGGKVVVLTSPVTASSSEIFSHVMQFHRRATVIGEKTAGLVEGGSGHSLPGGGYSVVASLDYVGLDGRRLEGIGVTPDIVAPLTLADLRAGRDVALDAALAALRADLAEN